MVFFSATFSSEQILGILSVMELWKRASELIHQTLIEGLALFQLPHQACAQHSRYRERSHRVPDFSLPRVGWRERRINCGLSIGWEELAGQVGWGLHG